MSAFSAVNAIGKIASTALRVATFPLRHPVASLAVGGAIAAAAMVSFGPFAALSGLYAVGSVAATVVSTTVGGIGALWSGAASAVTAAKTYLTYNALTCGGYVSALKGKLALSMTPDQLQQAGEIVKNCAAWIKPAPVLVPAP